MPDGITIIYGDNATGKSGYARLLKCIARARHHEEIFSDVFRDTGRDDPRARVAIRIGVHEVLLDGIVSCLPKYQRMLFYDSECGNAYISTESDFPYRPSALFVMDKLIEACTAVRSHIDARLVENSTEKKTPPVVDDMVSDTAAGRFLSNLSTDSSVERLDAIIGNLDDASETVENLRQQEARLVASDTSQERQHLNRNAEKLDSIAVHLEKVQTSLGPDAILELLAKRDRVRTFDEATSVLVRTFESEPLSGVGTSAWKELWEAARRFSETLSYPGDTFPVTSSDCRCVLCQQTLTNEGRGRLGRFEKFVKNDVQQQLAEAKRQLKTSSSQVSSLSVLSEAVETNLLDFEVSYSKLVSETRAALSTADDVRTAIVKELSDHGNLSGVKFECESLVARFREAATRARTDAVELADPEAAKKHLLIVTKKRMEIELLSEMKNQRRVIVEEIQTAKNPYKVGKY